MRIELRPGFWLFLPLLVWLDPLEAFVPFLLACSLHEAGHLAAIRLCGGSVTALRLDFADVQMETGFLSAKTELLCAAAGPAVNLLCLPLLHLFPRFAAISLLLATYNLLPIRPLDGGRILYAALTLHAEEKSARRICTGVGIVCCAVLAGAAVYAVLAWKTGLWPVFCAGILALKLFRVEKSVAFPRRCG